MDLKKTIQQKEEELKGYYTADEEIDFVDYTLFRKILGHKDGLYEYQKEFLLDVNTNKVVLLKKTRQSGYSTLVGAHIFNKVYDHFLSDNPEECKRFLFLSPNQQMSEDIKKGIYRLSECYCGKKHSEGKRFWDYIRDHIVYATSNNVYSKICSNVFEEVVIDEAAWVENFDEIFYSLCDQAKHIIAVSSLDEKVSKFEKLYAYFEETKPSDVCLKETKWWESPAFNKNLAWKKYEVEPTIDKEGNVKYNKEAWEKRIADGWIPTSPRYEELLKLFNRPTNELLN